MLTWFLRLIFIFPFIATCVMFLLWRLPDLLSGRNIGDFIVVLVVLAMAAYFLPWIRTFVIGAAVLMILLWQLVMPMYQAARRAADQAPEAIAQAVLDAGKAALDRLWEKVQSAKGTFDGTNIAEGVEKGQNELALEEDICNRLPFVQARFGDATGAYCDNLDLGVFKEAKRIGDSAGEGALELMYLLRGDPDRINNPEYLMCLGEAAAVANPQYLQCEPFDTSETRRICLELAIQAPTDDALSRQPLSPAITACRNAYVK